MDQGSEGDAEEELFENDVIDAADDGAEAEVEQSATVNPRIEQARRQWFDQRPPASDVEE